MHAQILKSKPVLKKQQRPQSSLSKQNRWVDEDCQQVQDEQMYVESRVKFYSAQLDSNKLKQSC